MRDAAIGFPDLNDSELAAGLLLLVMVHVPAICAAFGLGLTRRGFSPQFVLSCLFGAIGLSALIAAISYHYLDVSPDGSDPSNLLGALGVGVLTFNVLLGLAWVILPSRSPRTSGDRAVNYPVRAGAFAVAALLGTLGLSLAVAAWIYEAARYNSLWVAVLCLVSTIGYVASGIGFHRQRLATRKLQDVLISDPRPPVLFLREFKVEGRPFAIGRSDDLLQLIHPGQAFRAPLRSLWFPGGWLSCELFLSGAVERDLGPFVALGNPEDHLQPFGAARMYPGDESWQKAFTDLSNRAQAVLLLAGVSPQVSWEMDYLLSHGMASKLFVINDAAASTESGWLSFRSGAMAIGYDVPAEAPPFGSLMGFESDGSGAVLMESAVSPEDFTSSIQAHLRRSNPRGAGT